MKIKIPDWSDETMIKAMKALAKGCTIAMEKEK
jgi:hypothetical protein